MLKCGNANIANDENSIRLIQNNLNTVRLILNTLFPIDINPLCLCISMKYKHYSNVLECI